MTIHIKQHMTTKWHTCHLKKVWPTVWLFSRKESFWCAKPIDDMGPRLLQSFPETRSVCCYSPSQRPDQSVVTVLPRDQISLLLQSFPETRSVCCYSPSQRPDQSVVTVLPRDQISLLWRDVRTYKLWMILRPRTLIISTVQQRWLSMKM